MRKKYALLIAVLTGLFVAAASLLFAYLQS